MSLRANTCTSALAQLKRKLSTHRATTFGYISHTNFESGGAAQLHACSRATTSCLRATAQQFFSRNRKASRNYPSRNYAQRNMSSEDAKPPRESTHPQGSPEINTYCCKNNDKIQLGGPSGVLFGGRGGVGPKTLRKLSEELSFFTGYS